MRALAIFVMIFVIAGVPLGGAIWAIREGRRNKVLAGAPAGALVGPNDSTKQAKAKLRTYARYRSAVRLLGEVQRHDETMCFLPSDLRKEIDEAVEEFYAED